MTRKPVGTSAAGRPAEWLVHTLRPPSPNRIPKPIPLETPRRLHRDGCHLDPGPHRPRLYDPSLRRLHVSGGGGSKIVTIGTVQGGCRAGLRIGYSGESDLREGSGGCGPCGRDLLLGLRLELRRASTRSSPPSRRVRSGQDDQGRRYHAHSPLPRLSRARMQASLHRSRAVSLALIAGHSVSMIEKYTVSRTRPEAVIM